MTLVTGDTKVVDRGKGDQVFITTSGIGLVPEDRHLSIHNARPGDRILVSGTIGDHGIAIMSVREGIEFETVLESDTAPLNDLTEAMLDAVPDDPLHARPDARRAVERAQRAGRRVARRRALDEAAIPVRPRSAWRPARCSGWIPLYVANEGKLIAVVPPKRPNVLAAMRGHPLGRDAADHRRDRRRPSRHGDSKIDHRRRARRHDAGGRTTAEDLLMTEVRQES